jgi:hypothetical protein
MTAAPEDDVENPSRLDWRVDVPILTSPLLLKRYAMAILLAFFLMGGLLTFLALVSGNVRGIGSMWMLTGIALAVVIVAGFIGTAIFLRNRMAMRFIVDARGVEQLVVDRKAKAAAGAAVVVGAIAGSPGAAGAGLIAQAQSRQSAAWSALASVIYHPRQHAVSLRNSWRTVMIVFCTPANYAEVAARIEHEIAVCAGGGKVRRNPLPGLLLRSLISIVACLPFFVLPWPFGLDLFVPIFTLCFALASVWLIPYFAVATIGGLGWMWVDIAMRASAVRRSSLDGSVYRMLDRMDAGEWGPLAITAAATVVLLVVAVGLMRGRYGTALADDEAELEIDKEPVA